MCAKPEYFPSGSRIPKSMDPAARIRQADIEKEFPLFPNQAHTNDRGRARHDLRTAVFSRLKPQRPGRPDMILRQDAHENSSGGQIMFRPQEKKKTDRSKGISSAFTRRSLITICRIISVYIMQLQSMPQSSTSMIFSNDSGRGFPVKAVESCPETSSTKNINARS